MSARTPGLQPRSQYHSYWGQFVWNAAGSDPGAANLPNDTANPLPNPEFSKLETGDIASTTDGAVDANIGLWVCYDVGTVSGSDAKWRRLDNNAVITQTIRDAHVIVVAQTSTLSALSSVAIPPLAANALNLSIGVGDAVGITCDYLDPGDGSELTLALQAATAAGGQIDIRVRPCGINLDPTLAPLAVPANTRLIGAGERVSRITGGDGSGATTQCVFTLSTGASLEDLLIQSPAPLATVGGAEEGVVQILGGLASVLRCAVQFDGNTTATLGLDRVAVAAIRAPFPDFVVVDDCTLYASSLFSQNVPAISYGVWMGTLGGEPRFSVLDSEIRNTSIQGTGRDGGSAPRAVRFENMEGGRCFNVDHVNAENAESFSWAWDATPAFPGAAVPTRGCTFIECRVTTRPIPGQQQAQDNASQTGFTIEVLAGAGAPAGWSDFKIHDCEVVFRGTPSASFLRTGYLLKNAIVFDAQAAADVKLANVTFDNCKAYASRKGFRVDGRGNGSFPAGDIHSVKLTACQAKDMVATGSVDAEGLLVQGTNIEAAVPNVFNVGAVNCDFSSTPSGATNSGIRIFDAAVKDSLIGFNNLTPLGIGVALSDAGTGTEAAHNILA